MATLRRKFRPTPHRPDHCAVLDARPPDAILPGVSGGPVESGGAMVTDLALPPRP